MMQRHHRTAILRTLLLLCPLVTSAASTVARTTAEPASATPGVYRCGNSYGDAPCPGARQVETDDGRSDAQRRQAEQTKVQQARLATALAAERQARERAAAGQLAGRLGPTEAERERAARQSAANGAPKLADKGRKTKKKPPRGDGISRAA